MTPFFHPTSILALDDDPLFLESLDFQFSEDVACQTFTRADAALEHLLNQSGQHPCYARMYDLVAAPSVGLRMAMRNPGDALLRADVSGLRSIIDDPGREMRVSVAVVDYDMPQMNGLEFCRSIRQLPVKKILLTGKAGLEVAVEAFNEGLIDCFLQKQVDNVSDALRMAIRRLQKLYFSTVSRPISNALEICGSWFGDPAARALLRSTFEANAVEYCMSTTPPGVIMRDRGGKEMFMLITDHRELAAQIATAEARGAPSEFLDQLIGGKTQAWFPTNDGRYTADYNSRWQMHIWPAEELIGNGHWMHSLISIPDKGATELAQKMA